MRAFLALGSNLGDRRALLREAVASIPELVAVSAVYETPPFGPPGQGPYLNMVVELDTDRDPRELLALCHQLEADAERVRIERWGPRTLDVDIVWMEGVEMVTDDLTIPHARAHERQFVLVPLADLDAELADSLRTETVDEPPVRLGAL